MRKTLLLVVGGLLVVCGAAMATPTNVIEMPTGTVVGDEEWNFGVDLGYDWDAGTTGYTAGVTYGFAEDFEFGLDATNRINNNVYANLKWRVTDEGKDDCVAVGLMDWGFSGNSPNMIYAVATLAGDESDDARFHIGAYYGDEGFLGDNVNLMAGVDFGDEDWRGYIDYIAGNNPRGAFSAGVGYLDDEGEWGAKLGYQHANQSGANSIFMQVDYWAD